MTSVWILAGIIGGAIAGLVDAGIAIAGGIGGMSVGKAIRLVTLSASLLAAAGGLGGLLIAAGDALVQRTRHPARWAGALWTLAWAPLVVYDAFALFSGPRAARIPAHGADLRRRRSWRACWRSALLVWIYARLGSRSPRAARDGAGAGRDRRRRSPTAACCRGSTAGSTSTLSVATLAAFVLAARLRRAAPRRRRLIVAALVAAAGCAGALFELRNSQVMRYAAHERTALAALVLRAVPVSLQSRTIAAAERHAAEVALPPLPEGPRRPDADVLLITVDALRADHVGAYGYPRATTPQHRRAGARAARASSAPTRRRRTRRSRSRRC